MKRDGQERGDRGQVDAGRTSMIEDLAKKVNGIRAPALSGYEAAYADPGFAFKEHGIEAPEDFVELYRTVICCRDSNHEGRTTRFLPIEEIAGFREDLRNGFIPFYDYLDFCWVLYVRAIPGSASQVFCEIEATQGKTLKLEYTDSIEAFLEKVVAQVDVFSEVNAMASRMYPRIKL
jgi:hypothetical protein